MKACTQLKIFLLTNGISQSKLSKDTGLHKNTVSNLVRTGEGSKSVKMLVKLYLEKTTKEELDLNILLKIANGKEG